GREQIWNVKVVNGVAKVLPQLVGLGRERLGHHPHERYGTVHDLFHALGPSRMSRMICTPISCTPNFARISLRAFLDRSWIRRTSSGSLRPPPAACWQIASKSARISAG